MLYRGCLRLKFCLSIYGGVFLGGIFEIIYFKKYHIFYVNYAYFYVLFFTFFLTALKYHSNNDILMENRIPSS